MVMFMIKGELYKLLRSKSVKVLFILLLILNSLQIIYVNYQNIYGDINTGKRRILKIIEGLFLNKNMIGLLIIIIRC